MIVVTGCVVSGFRLGTTWPLKMGLIGGPKRRWKLPFCAAQNSKRTQILL